MKLAELPSSVSHHLPDGTSPLFTFSLLGANVRMSQFCKEMNHDVFSVYIWQYCHDTYNLYDCGEKKASLLQGDKSDKTRKRGHGSTPSFYLRFLSFEVISFMEGK